MVVLVSTAISTLALIVCQFFSYNLTTLYVFIFIFGLTIGPRCLLSYVLAVEMTPHETQSFYTSFAMFIDSACMVTLGVYFYYIKSMDALMIAMTLLNFVLIIIIWYGVPESPKFLYERQRKEEFIQALEWIAKVNRINIRLDEIMALDKSKEIELPQLSPAKFEDAKDEEEDDFDKHIRKIENL